jgi:selenocysteine lyase/cysteine desulfurase
MVAMRPGPRVVVAAHVVPVSGAVLPVADIARVAHANDSWVVVDGRHAAGALPVDVAAIGADAYAVAGETWPLGPEGTGALWASKRLIEHAASGAAATDEAAGHETLTAAGVAVPWPDARRWDATSFHRPSIVGLARTLGWLEMYVGLPWAFDRAARLARHLASALAAIEGVTLLAAADAIAAIVSFRVTGWSAPEIAEELERRIFAIVAVLVEADAVRASVAFFNTEEELDRFADLVRQLAGHTPASMPKRPTLIVMSSPDVARASRDDG